MKISKPHLSVEFYIGPCERVLYVVRTVSGDDVNCNSSSDAINLLEIECGKFLDIIKNLEHPKDTTDERSI